VRALVLVLVRVGAGCGVDSRRAARRLQALKASLLLPRLVKATRSDERVVADAHVEGFGFTCLVDQVFQVEELSGSTPADRLRLIRAEMQLFVPPLRKDARPPECMDNWKTKYRLALIQHLKFQRRLNTS